MNQCTAAMLPGMTQPTVQSTIFRLRRELLDGRCAGDHWEGQLSASALSTATAVSSLCLAVEKLSAQATPNHARVKKYRGLIEGGVRWLELQQNEDGGFGDTDRSHSNIATSYLVLAARALANRIGIENVRRNSKSVETSEGTTDLEVRRTESDERLKTYLKQAGGIAGLRKRYGTDKTFVVPILTNLAIAGLVDWKEVSPLPFEAAVFPQSMYRFLGMPVVSYAVPALVAIGQAKFLKSGCLPPWSWVRRASIAPTLKVLQRMQPDSGGYLEATPLTSFVVMSLLDTDRLDHPVVENGLAFIEQSVSPEHSWPIDTNLATWVTSLSVLALSQNKDDPNRQDWATDEIADWLLSCQHNVRHPFTGADPGGWGWTDLSGAVPDADDTPGAMIALSTIRSDLSPDRQSRVDEAISRGRDWLLGLQNRDGGWPTFCRGWGKLPFDRSSVDLTAHAIRALRLSASDSSSMTIKTERAIESGLRFIRRQQQNDGAWLPLWFGNQDRTEEDNPIYGTSKVLVDSHPKFGGAEANRGIAYLVESQNSDGGWGGGPSVAAEFGLQTDQISTVEETALAVEALASLPESRLTNPARDAILSGSEWLVRAIADDRHQAAWPIGFYFAKLWYYERLYPTIFALSALARVDAMPSPLAFAPHPDATT